MADVSADDFKGALGSWAAGVTVVTTRHDRLVYGLTVSSFSSLSLEPRLITVCLANSNKIVQMVGESQMFAEPVKLQHEGRTEGAGIVDYQPLHDALRQLLPDKRPSADPGNGKPKRHDHAGDGGSELCRREPMKLLLLQQ